MLVPFFVVCLVLLLMFIAATCFSLSHDLASKQQELEDLQAWFKTNDANHISERNERDRILSLSQKALDENAKELKSLLFSNNELSKSISEYAEKNAQLNSEIVSLQNTLNTANKAAAEQSDAIEFLQRSADGKHRIVSSGDLIGLQISEAQANGRFFVESKTGLGWALLPWELNTEKDLEREARKAQLNAEAYAELGTKAPQLAKPATPTTKKRAKR